MRKIFLLTALILTVFASTTFAAADDVKIAIKDFGVYKSADYGYSIKCPIKPIVTNLKFDEPAHKGEMLVFLNDGAEIVLGYRIILDAFPENAAPDFNKDDEKTLNSYLDYLKTVNLLDTAIITKVGENNKGVFMVTAKEVENDEGEKITADSQIAMVIFRTKNGGRVSIQLLTNEFSQELVDAFLYSVSTFDDSK
ncbi:MAG: hypothetical protein IKZ58_02895 [Selenomonadaceae bacterium]|nr:hypothetical protein [Selenomonadaceae bacterium]